MSEPVKTRKLILIGDSAFAEVAFEYFTYDSEYEVVAFAVERAYRKRDSFLGLPVVDFEEIAARFAPDEHYFYAALVYTQGNKLRTRLFEACRSIGFKPASYISRHAFVWRDVKIGEHAFIFENNVIQPRVEIGTNVVLWSGNHIGHHSRIGDNSFLSSHVVISGFVNIGTHCFMGVNATVANNIDIGNHCLVGAAALVLGNVPDRKVVTGIWKTPKPVPANSSPASAAPGDVTTGNDVA
jgi:sugar O-acyltransferase (sialic acid O-acetyltransferase NeuD family)